MAKTRKTKPRPERSSEVPVTQSMLFLVRDDLRAEIRSLDAKVESRFLSHESLLHKMMSEIHQTRLLVEEQNARNRIALDGLNVLFERQDRVERKLDKSEGF